MQKILPLGVSLLLLPLIWVLTCLFVSALPLSAEAQNTKSESQAEPKHDPMTEGSSENDPGIGKQSAPYPETEIRNRRMATWHYNQGNLALKKKNWPEAERNYRMALEMDSALAEAYLNLSTVYLRSGQKDKALLTLKKLEAIKPDLPQLHYNLACYYSLTGDIAAGMVALKKSVELGFGTMREIEGDPDLANLRNDRAFREWQSGMKGGSKTR